MCEEYKLTREMIEEDTRKRHPDWDDISKKCAERFKMLEKNPDLIDDTEVANILKKHHEQVIYQNNHKNPKSFSVRDDYVCDGGDCK